MGGMADHLEIEQKFEVDGDFVRPTAGTLRAGLRAALGIEVAVADPVAHRLSATYYDTPDQRLAASKITLRRRTGGSDAGWHLKLPAAQGARREVQEPLSDGPVPERLAAAVADVADGLPLAPIAVLATERVVVSVLGDDGGVIAEIADDVVNARRVTAQTAPANDGAADDGAADDGAAAGSGLRWREVEVEVPRAWPELQRAVADLLLAAGARPAGHGSKLARLLQEK
jgi:hypothetical protein